MARPLKQIDTDLVLKLAMIGCTTAEISAVLDVSSDTLERRFAACLIKGRDQGKTSLRRMQWKSAEGGNTSMQIWLGKQLLGQRDRTDHTLGDLPAGGSLKIVLSTADGKL
jgi:hypothetical protein